MVIEDVLKAAFDASGIDGVYYTGTEAMVAKKLTDSTNRYTMVAVVLPIFETTFANLSGYVNLRLPRVVVATKTQTTDTPATRLTTTFKPILIPAYETYMASLAKQAGIIDRDWHLWPKEKWNSYGEIPATDKVEDVLDAIEVRDIIFRVDQKIC